MTRDKIFIRDLLVRGIIGINDWEREKKQDILINLILRVDSRPGGGTRVHIHIPLPEPSRG